jgi:hypothetical protein
VCAADRTVQQGGACDRVVDARTCKAVPVEAVSFALTALLPHLPRYQRSLANYARLLMDAEPRHLQTTLSQDYLDRRARSSSSRKDHFRAW